MKQVSMQKQCYRQQMAKAVEEKTGAFGISIGVWIRNEPTLPPVQLDGFFFHDKRVAAEATATRGGQGESTART